MSTEKSESKTSADPVAEMLFAKLNDGDFLDEKAIGAALTRMLGKSHREVDETLNQKWPEYTNPFLKSEIEALTPEDINIVNKLTAALSKESSEIFGSSVKKLGAKTQPKGNYDFSNVVIKGEFENLIGRQTELNTNLPDPIKKACNIKKTDRNIIEIFDDPLDDKKAIVECYLQTPPGTCAWDSSRPNFGRYVLVVGQNSETLEFLRSGKNGRLFVYALRNMIVDIDPDLSKYVDVPLQESSNPEGGDSLCVLDVPNKKIIDFESIEDRLSTYDNDDNFLIAARNLGIVDHHKKKILNIAY